MKKIPILILSLAIWTGCSIKNADYFKPKKSVILNSEAGQSLVNQYSRDGIDSVEAFWVVTEDDIEFLENNFRKITSLKVSYDKLDSLEAYAFQYVGVIINGEKFIYINAFPAPYADRRDPYTKDWTRQPIKVNDGGNGFWGALFDIKKKRFSKLSINGSA